MVPHAHQPFSEVLANVDLTIFRAALIAASQNTHSISTLHLEYLRYCLDTGAYDDALPVLAERFYEFTSESRSAVQDLFYKETGVNLKTLRGQESAHTRDKLTVLHVQEFLLLGAMVYIALRRWTEAEMFLEHVLTTPSNHAANGFMLEAYRKWVLVGCLLHGSLPKTPRTTNTSAMRAVQNASRAYDGLAEAFRDGNKAKFLAEMDVGVGIWSAHGNLGLVEELLDQFPLFAIRTLKKIYSALPLDTVATHLSLSVPDTHAYLQTLIASGQINAAVEPRSSSSSDLILRFFSDPRHGPLATTEEAREAALIEQTRRVTELAQDVRAADRRLATSREYLVHVRSGQGKGDAGERGSMIAAVMEEIETGQIPMELLAEGLEDEDMMGDLP